MNAPLTLSQALTSVHGGAGSLVLAARLASFIAGQETRRLEQEAADRAEAARWA